MLTKIKQWWRPIQVVYEPEIKWPEATLTEKRIAQQYPDIARSYETSKGLMEAVTLELIRLTRLAASPIPAASVGAELDKERALRQDYAIRAESLRWVLRQPFYAAEVLNKEKRTKKESAPWVPS